MTHGSSQTQSSGNAIAALEGKLAVRARVRRDGGSTTCAPSDVVPLDRAETAMRQAAAPGVLEILRGFVPGDVIRMRLGDIVPADARTAIRSRSISLR